MDGSIAIEMSAEVLWSNLPRDPRRLVRLLLRRRSSTHNRPSLKLAWRSPSTENICCGKHVLDEFIKLSFATKKHKKSQKGFCLILNFLCLLWQKFGSHHREHSGCTEKSGIAFFVRRLTSGGEAESSLLRHSTAGLAIVHPVLLDEIVAGHSEADVRARAVGR